MGSCQMKNCKCICTQNRVNCSCGSQISLALDEQLRDAQKISANRSNRFIRKSSLKRKQNNNDSPLSSDTMKQTKHSTNYNMQQSKYYMYLLSEECNLSSEPSIKKYSIKAMNVKSKTYFNPNDVYIETPKRKEFLYPSQTVPENMSSFEAFQAVETQQINQSISKSMKGLSPTDELKVSQNLSLQQQMSGGYSLDRKQPKKGALKLSQNSNESFRTQQVQRKVRFNLPHSFYVRERQKQQQLFFK